MNKDEGEQTIRRILVALDSSPASLTVLEQAVALAAGFQAELTGLFVEDINLVHLAELSFTQEVGLFSATSRRLEIQYVKRQLRGQANRVRQALAARADRAGVKWSFRVGRGVIAAELLAAASEADLIVLGRVGGSPRQRRLGSTTRAILLQARPLTLIVHPTVRLHLPFLIFYDGSVAAQKGLATAAQFTRIQNLQLTVLILADMPEAAQQFQQEAVLSLKEEGLTARYLWWDRIDSSRLLRLLQVERYRLLVLPSYTPWLDHEMMPALLDQVECSVLLVHARSGP